MVGRTPVDPRSSCRHADHRAARRLLGPSTLVLPRTRADGVTAQRATWVVFVAEVQRQVLGRERAERAQLAMQLRVVEVTVDQELGVRR